MAVCFRNIAIALICLALCLPLSKSGQAVANGQSDYLNVVITEVTDDSVTLEWNKLKEADSYKVYWADKDTDLMEYEEIAETEEQAFVFNGSTHVNHFFKVAPIKNGDEGRRSSAVKSPVEKQFDVQLEALDRGLVAVDTGEGVFLSWRLLKEEAVGYSDHGLVGTVFNVYRDGQFLKTVTDSTNYLDEHGTPTSSYYVSAINGGGEEASDVVHPWENGYYELPLRKPEDGVTPAGEAYTYHANDMSVGDVNGDGQYEFFVKWEPTNSKDVSQKGYTGNTYIDAYTLTGDLLYRIDLGKNIRSGAHYTQLLVYDFDGDGKAELMFKTAPGTKVITFTGDGKVESETYITMPQEDVEAGYSHEDDYRMSADDYYAHVVEMFIGWHEHEEVKNGNWPETLEEAFGIEPLYDYPLSRGDAEALADYFIDEYAPSRSANNQLRDFEGFIVEGPEYLTVFAGETGQELQTIHYKPGREDDGLMWGDYAMNRIEPGNRVDRFLAGVAYLDGEKPSAIFARGYYTRTTLVAYDWDGEQLHENWFVDSGWTPMENPFHDSPHGVDGTNDEYATLTTQGAHSLSVADVDGDGKHEIIYGAATIDDDGTLLYSSFAELPPESAAPGEMARLGHGDALHVADIDPDRPGLESFMVFEGAQYAPYGFALHDARTGDVLYGEYSGRDTGRGMVGDVIPGERGLETWAVGLYSASGKRLGTEQPGTNMNIKWSPDMTTQIVNGALDETPTIDDWQRGRLLTAEGTRTNNGTKGNPSLVADIFGDWREELLVRTEDSSAIRIYMNTERTDRKLYTLMHDPQYRTGIAWQNVTYNQPSYPSFYFASDIDWAYVPLFNEHEEDRFVFLEKATEAFIVAGEVQGPLVVQLTQSLKQAKHHNEAGRTKQALSFIDKYKRHLHNRANERHVSKEAKEQLNRHVETALQQWESGQK
ncbi:FIMAH domain-containing protein [Shouchella clausii]|uniref:Rhamnogalacturonan lyase n=1 Tax=Shouchella clausii TaxID=79880 RepID=A0A268S5J5_SHOCL|nr:rhamnogalacturonan lyase [Shouchella clausii]PAD43564.1 rhamnogalacturonan lyase [Bacillus sp. 7520-S]PAE98727.1 rhamnogalacturonan lyase [Shouchella clausii]PAF27677.1 rhamnogalacturonan lyase [Shouchella clausii]